MKLEQTFTVQATPETVWEALIDVERVAPCLPGAAVTGQEDDGSYKGEFKVKLGPTTAAYTGTLKMTTVDAGAQRATMDARGNDKRGQGGATASIVSQVQADAAGTKVDIVTDFAITGRLARFGRGGMIQDVANRLLREFAANLEAMLQADGAATAGQPAAPGDGDGASADAVAAAADADAAPGLGAAAGAMTGSAPQPPPQSRTPPPASAAPLSGGSVMLGALTDGVRRQPLRVAGVAAGLLGLVVAVLRRRR